MEIGLNHMFCAVLLFVCLYKNASPQSTKDDRCMLDSGNVGNCIHIDKCPEAIALVRARRRPKICRFIGFEAIVCCEIKKLSAIRSNESIAKQKCSQYNPSITTTTTTPDPNLHWLIGGVNAKDFEFPHMVSLGYGNVDNTQWLCAGSLVSNNFVLTAAHCTETRFGPVRWVKIGLYLWKGTYPTYLDKIPVENIFKHPKYTKSKGYHDIALLELKRDANFVGARPACLHVSKELPNDTFIATGWGAGEIGGDIQNVLQKVTLKHVPFNSCTSFYRSDKRLPNGLNEDWQLCADGGGHRRDTCQGDSGGPLQTKNGDGNDNFYTIVGITSLGIKCAIVPSVYTRVSNYVPWIESIVWDS